MYVKLTDNNIAKICSSGKTNNICTILVPIISLAHFWNLVAVQINQNSSWANKRKHNIKSSNREYNMQSSKIVKITSTFAQTED